MSKSVSRFILPFVVPSKDRREPFNDDMKRAAVFCLAEMSRDKGGGLISRKPPEEIAFITETCYPFWLIPWRRRTLLFDGFGIMKHKVSYDILPELQVFINEVKGSADKPESYLASLSSNLNYFQGFTGKGEKIVNGLVTDPNFTQDFLSYLSKARRIRGSISNRVILSPIVDESAVKIYLKSLSDLRSYLERDVENLRKISDFLVKKTRRHVKVISMQIEEIQRRSEAKMARFKSKSMKKIEKIRKKYDKKIVQVARETDLKIQELQQVRVKLEAEKKRLINYVANLENEISISRLQKDEAKIKELREEQKRCKKELSEKDKRIKEINRRIEDLKPERDLEISRLKSEYNSQKEAIMEGLKKIEVSRDTKIQMKQQISKSLQESTSAIITQINRLLNLRKQVLNEFEKLGLPITKRKYSIVYLPFFLVCYQRGMNRRYHGFSPSVANSMGALTKFKGAFGTSRLKMLLEERSAHIKSFINRFIDVIEQNPMLNERISDAGVKASILRTRMLRRRIEKGLIGLREEGWLSENDFKLFSTHLSK